MPTSNRFWANHKSSTDPHQKKRKSGMKIVVLLTPFYSPARGHADCIICLDVVVVVSALKNFRFNFRVSGLPEKG